jgi:hypothetical protein
VAQAEQLLCKHKALSLNPSPTSKKKKRKKFLVKWIDHSDQKIISKETLNFPIDQMNLTFTEHSTQQLQYTHSSIITWNFFYNKSC